MADITLQLPLDEISYLADLVEHEIDTIITNEPDRYYGPDDLDLLRCTLKHLDEARNR